MKRNNLRSILKTTDIVHKELKQIIEELNLDKRRKY